MTFVIELNESTAARRAVPFRLFTSNGTTPDTNASDGTILWSVNGGAQRSGISISAISANAGMYYAQLSQSNVSVLGSIAIYTDTIATDFPQHVGNVQVVNFNPYSTQSNILVDDIAAGSYSGVTIQGLSNYANISNVTLHAGTHSAATVQGLSNYANISNVTLHAGTHSDVTIQGLSRIDSSVTIANANYSAVTVRVTGIVASSFGAGAIDAAALATDAGQEIADRVLARNIEGGDDSGRSVGQALWPLRNRVQISGSTGTVYLNDDTTSGWTFSVTTIAAVGISDLNPAD